MTLKLDSVTLFVTVISSLHMPDDEGEENKGDGGYGPIRTGSLEDYVKKETDEMYKGGMMWANDDAIDLLEQQLLEVAKYVWVEAAEQTWKDDRRIVQPEEVDQAFNDLILPQNILLEAANEMKRIRWEFLDIAEQSPAISIDKEKEEDRPEYGDVTEYNRE